MNRYKHAKKLAYFCVLLILVLVIVFSGLQILESTVFSKYRVQEQSADTKTITVDGVDYFPRQDITVMMVLGIDRFGPVTDSGSYRNTGAADMIMLLIFDEQREVLDVLYLNRDTMLEMPVLGITGRQAGTYYGQLALSHSYGSGLEDSCENVKNTLEEFLPGASVDYYLSMNMDAISILNDAVGGVKVTVEDDFSQVDPSITKGEIILHGEQAIHYVRGRANVGDQLNVTRMQRQRGYVEGFLEALSAEEAENPDFIVTTYEEVSPYLVTDCSVNTISALLERYADFELARIVSPQGENRLGERHYEFYVDEEALESLVLDLFYAPK